MSHHLKKFSKLRSVKSDLTYFNRTVFDLMNYVINRWRSLVTQAKPLFSRHRLSQIDSLESFLSISKWYFGKQLIEA